jgi:hypothetical protein
VEQVLQTVVVPILIGGIVASLLARCIALVFSKRVRTSIARHPVAHISWLLASLLAILVLIAWVYPRFAGRGLPAS